MSRSRSQVNDCKELDNLIDERVLKYEELWMKEKEVQAIKEIERWLQESEMQKQESLVTDGTALEACLITEGAVMEDMYCVNMGRAFGC
ncbi:hypothetical protein Tco_0688898 [Tanacetum coccineum]